MARKLYDLVKELLEKYRELRSSDKKLIWAVWKLQGMATTEYIRKDYYYAATSPETITRCRRKIQENFPNLQSIDPRVVKARRLKADQKGTHIYRETA